MSDEIIDTLSPSSSHFSLCSKVPHLTLYYLYNQIFKNERTFFLKGRVGRLFDIFAANSVGFISRPLVAVSTTGVYEADAFVAKSVEVIALSDGSAQAVIKPKHLHVGMALTNEEATGAKMSKTLGKPINMPHLFSRTITI